MTTKLLMGNEAMAHAALEAGVGVVAGYPGTPSSEIVETIARQHKLGTAHGVHVEWSTNEKVALELLFGASLAGKRGLFTCKQMGLNVASDALMSLNYVSVCAGLVLIVADDPGPISSQTEQDTRRFAAFAKVPVLDPATPEQAYQMVKQAFELSERFHTPVIVRPTTRIDHASVFLDIADETEALTINTSENARLESDDPGATQALPNGFTRNPNRWVIFPRRAYEAHGEINERLDDIAALFSDEPTFSQFNPVEEVASSASAPSTRYPADSSGSGAVFGILASGISASYAREALRMIEQSAQEAGVPIPGYRFMQVGTPYPFPEKAVAAFANGLADILVLEELDYVLEDQLMRLAGRMHASFNVHGKLTGEARDRGENDVDDITARIERFLGLTGRLSLYRLRDASETNRLTISLEDEQAANLPARPPVLCAGCPHRASFYAVKRALRGEPAVMCGDIGCYTLGNAAPLDAVDTCLCMGGGITMAQGIAVADPGKKAIAYVGDSTFFASGMTGIANAAYNNHDITVVVLDNSTTAMTGAQPHPGTGVTLIGATNEPLDIEDALRSCGVTAVYRANPLDCDASIAAVEDALSFEGPSAVIFESPCAQIVPADPAALVNPESCTGCKRCITTIGCPALSFNKNAAGPRSGTRGLASIDTSLCVGCDLCVQVCPFNAILPGEVAADLGIEPTLPADVTVLMAAVNAHPDHEAPAGASEPEEQVQADATVAVAPVEEQPEEAEDAPEAENPAQPDVKPSPHVKPIADFTLELPEELNDFPEFINPWEAERPVAPLPDEEDAVEDGDADEVLDDESEQEPIEEPLQTSGEETGDPIECEGDPIEEAEDADENEAETDVAPEESEGEAPFEPEAEPEAEPEPELDPEPQPEPEPEEPSALEENPEDHGGHEHELEFEVGADIDDEPVHIPDFGVAAEFEEAADEHAENSDAK